MHRLLAACLARSVMIIIMKEVGIVVVVTTRRIGMRTLAEMDALPLVLEKIGDLPPVAI